MKKLRHYQTLPDALLESHGLLSQLTGHKISVFLDYDGTLTPIMSHPEEAVLSDGMRKTISALSQLVMMAIVSGRNKSNIQDLIKLPDIFYIGNHGFDIEGPNKAAIHLEVGLECLPALETCYQELLLALRPLSGVQFEPKKLTVTIHYRFIEEQNIPLFFALMQKIVAQYPALKLTAGKKVLEIRPNIDWNKGVAMLWLVEKLGLNHPNNYIIYIGDDLTDEDAFRILPAQGVGILVGNHEDETYADYHLADPGQVEIFLQNLIKFVDV